MDRAANTFVAPQGLRGLAAMSENEIHALITLIDDPDEDIYAQVRTASFPWAIP
ncbi:MAG: hypothetical protein IPO79_15670 [Flavobacteriales bacterium]|nr:hypothetical protein [Flavobacteriales bacterium]